MDNPFAAIYGGQTATVTPQASSSNPFASIYGKVAAKSTSATPPTTPTPTQNWNGQQIPANIATKNLVTYDPKTGYKTFNLGAASPGVYTVDKNNNPVNTGHTTYGGVPPKTGFERADIIPVSLGGANNQAGNIAYEPLLPKSQQKPGGLTQSDVALKNIDKTLPPKAKISAQLAEQQAHNFPNTQGQGFFGTLNSAVQDFGKSFNISNIAKTGKQALGDLPSMVGNTFKGAYDIFANPSPTELNIEQKTNIPGGGINKEGAAGYAGEANIAKNLLLRIASPITGAIAGGYNQMSSDFADTMTNKNIDPNLAQHLLEAQKNSTPEIENNPKAFIDGMNLDKQNLTNLSNQITSLSGKVDTTSQKSVNNYNSLIDQYKTGLDNFNAKAKALTGYAAKQDVNQYIKEQTPQAKLPFIGLSPKSLDSALNMGAGLFALYDILSPMAKSASIKLSDIAQENSSLKMPITHEDLRNITIARSDLVDPAKVKAYQEAASNHVSLKKAVQQGFIELQQKNPTVTSNILKNAATRPISEIGNIANAYGQPIKTTTAPLLTEKSSYQSPLEQRLAELEKYYNETTKPYAHELNATKPAEIAHYSTEIAQNAKTAPFATEIKPTEAPVMPKTAPETAIIPKVGESPLYHGTPQEIKNNTLTYGMKSGQDSGGIFLTDNKQSAETFAFGGKVHEISPEIKNQTIDLTDNKNINLFKKEIGKTYTNYDGEKLTFTQQDFEAMFPNGKTDFASVSQYPELVQKVVDQNGMRGIAFNEYAGGQIGKTYQILNGDIPLKPQTAITGKVGIAQEATKYKSAEEFVKAQGKTVYRGGKDLSKENITNSGISVSSGKNVAEDFVKQKGGTVQEHLISPDAKIINYADVPNVKFKNLNDYSPELDTGNRQIWRDLEVEYQKAVDWAKSNGYDGVKLPLEGETRIINPEVLKTKSQLTDIWNKANTPTEKPITGKAPTLSKPNEFYKQFYNSNDESTFVKVEAKPVDLGIKADTFIHKGTNGKGWIVTEGQTGTLISTGNTQVKAIQSAKELVEKQGQQKFDEAIQKRIEQNGLTPRYTKPLPEIATEKQSSITLNAEIIPGLSKTIEQDIIPKAKGIANSAAEMYKFIATAFNPIGQAPSKAVDILMTKKGEMEKALFQTEQATKEINKMWDKQPEAARLNFMDKVETSQPVDPAMHDLAQMYRERLDNAYSAIEKYKDIPFLENFFPHFWEKPGQISNFLSKRPLAGSKSFLKQRVFETIQDGINAGYKPVSTNPEQLMQIYEQNVRKFTTAQEIKQDMIDKGFWKFVKNGEKAPADFARIEDSIARVYFPQKLEGGGTTIAQGGEYYVQKDVARLINNFLSKDLIRDTPIGKGLMNMKNTMNAFQLGFSAFHLTMETLDTVVSKLSVGVSKIVSGKPLEGLTDILKAPAAPVSYFKAGQKFFNGDAELRKIEDELFTGGAKLGSSQYFKNTVFDTFTKNVREGNYIGALVRSPMALIEGTMRPLFSYYIPRLKVGAFRDLFASELQRNSAKIQSGELTQENVARDVWNNIENRMGELNYDNLFWNKNLKGAMMLTFRAVGWNLGTVRELGGGIFQDLPKAVGKGVTGKGFDFTPKMSYTFSLFLVMGMAGAIYQYLHTGKKPQGLKDLYYPMNGEKDQNGDDYRIEFPSYLKDLYQYSHNPVQTISNKLAPELTTIIDLLQNKDFFGDYIRNTNDKLPTQIKQVAAYLATNFTPFTYQQIAQQQKGQAKITQEVEAFFGLIKAPANAIQSDKTKAIYQALQDKMGTRGAQTPEQKEITQLKAQARLELQRGDETTLNKLKAMGVIKPGASERAFRKAAQLTPAERANQSLPKAQRK